MKIDREELLELVSLWPLSHSQHERIREIVTSEPMTEGAWLFRYYGRRPSKVATLEREFAENCGVAHAIAVNSGTSALIAGLAALGVSPGDDVLVPAYTFVATACAVLVAGGIPNLVEVDDTLTMDVVDLERKITPRSKAIVPVHMRGRTADMDAIVHIARSNGLAVIEDVAQACGGSYRGRSLGSIGHVGCFSFGQYKLLNAGEGGMVVTNDHRLATRIRSYHDTAACWRPERYASERMPGELFHGENFRMSELHGAVALAQLRKLSTFLTACREFQRSLCDGLEHYIEPFVQVRDHDSRGNTAEWLLLLAPTSDSAQLLLRSLRSEGVTSQHTYTAAPDWHIYSHWEHLLRRRTANRVSHPYSCYPMQDLKYSPDACPRTLERLGRTVMVHIPALARAGTSLQAQSTLRRAVQRTLSEPRTPQTPTTPGGTHVYGSN